MGQFSIDSSAQYMKVLGSTNSRAILDQISKREATKYPVYIMTAAVKPSAKCSLK